MSKYTITAVGSRDPYLPKKWSSKNGGEMISYKLQLTDESGEAVQGIIELAQKASSPAPKKGEELEGTIDFSGQYGAKFKKDFSAGKFGGGTKAPRDETSIRAQFAIKTAVALYGALSPSVRDGIKENGMEWVEDKATKFYQMVDRVKGAATPDPAKTPTDDFRKGISDSLAETFGSEMEELMNDDGGF